MLLKTSYVSKYLMSITLLFSYVLERVAPYPNAKLVILLMFCII